MLCAYRTDDLSLVNALPFKDGHPTLSMASDGRLFVSLMDEYPRSIPTLNVIDTDKCEIVDSHYYGLVNFSTMTYDPGFDKLFCTTLQPVKKESEYGPVNILEPSNKLMIINLDDYSAETVTFSDEPLGFLAFIPSGDKRLLLTMIDEKLKYYVYE